MATKKNTDVRYTTDIHIRLKIEERDSLQQKADEYGMSLSQTARSIIVRKLDGSEDSVSGISEKEASYRTLQAMQSVKRDFKKISVDVGRYVTSYEKSLTMVNSRGEPAINTEMTIRTAASVVKRILELQDGINSVIRVLGGAEIHVAAKPATGTAIGDNLAGGETSPAHPTQKKQTPETKALQSSNSIPLIFSSDMFTVTFDGVLLADCETYNDGKWERIRIRLKVDLYRNGRSQTYEVDAIDFANRYKNVIPHLKKDAVVIISGEFDFSVGNYNGVASKANATVEIKSLNFPPAVK